MSQENSNVHSLSPLEKLRRIGIVSKRDAEQRLEDAHRTLDRINAYTQVMELVFAGGMTLATQGPRHSRGFFVRSYARRVDAPSLGYEFDECHVPAFSSNPSATANLPQELQATEEDIKRVPCRTTDCKNTQAYLVGVLSVNKVGYHGAPSSVSFFAVCPTCCSAAFVDGGLPVERESAESLTA
jgi:hypothetical protein